MLRVAADDPLGAYPFGHKFGCSIEDGRKLLQLSKQLGLQVIGVWYVALDVFPNLNIAKSGRLYQFPCTISS